MSQKPDLERTTSSRDETDLSLARTDRVAQHPSPPLAPLQPRLDEVSRELAAAGTSLDGGAEVVICIPAFRRPDQLRQTLESVRRQVTSLRYAVVVVENDAARRGSAGEALRFIESTGLPGLCVIEPRQGNCQAINAAFETALAAFPEAFAVLMIDDDEIASPRWLDRMVNAARASGADVVGGPVFPSFTDGKHHLAEHPAFGPAYATSGPVPVIYGSGNCLIRRSVFARLARPSFDLRFNFLGGGDTDFFARCRQAGLRFYWAADATITETVPPERTRTGWILRRGLRIGAINYLTQRGLLQSAPERLRFVAKMAALLPYSVVRGARVLRRGGGGLMALHPVAVALGSLLAAVGLRPQPYRAKP
jgi:hypothetical protein